MGMISEFKEFIMRGNVMDMAVGVIVGGAFNTIVSSLVDDIIMPVISLATGKIDFTNLFFALDGGSYKSLAQAKGRRSGGIRIRQLHPERPAVPDRRVRPVPCHQGHEQTAQAGAGSGTDHQDLPVLQERGADRGDQMRILHQRIVQITPDFRQQGVSLFPLKKQTAKRRLFFHAILIRSAPQLLLRLHLRLR